MRNEPVQDASLAEELPYWEFFSDPIPHAVLTDGSVVAGISVGLKDIECLDADEINQFTVGLRSALNAVSEDATIQFVLSVDSEFGEVIGAYKAGLKDSAHPLVRQIAEGRLSEFSQDKEDGVLYRPRLFSFIRIPMKDLKKVGFLKKVEAFVSGSEASYREGLEQLSQNLGVVTGAFEALKLECKNLEKCDLERIAYRFLNPRRSSMEPAPTLQKSGGPALEKETLKAAPWLASQSQREQLVFGDLVLDFDQFTLDGHYHRVLTLKTLPEMTFAGMFSAFLRMPFHYDLILSIEVPPQADEMAKLNQKRRMAHSMSITQGNRASDLESESKLSSTEELIRELLNTGQRIYAVQLTLILRASVGAEGRRLLDRNVREALARFRALGGAEGLEESVGSWKVYKGSLPMAPIGLERKRRMKTNNLADFLPVYGPREGDQDPTVLFRNRLGGLVGFNPFDPGLPNYNCLVTGSAGAGKSFANNFILLQELARKLRVFIIDIGGSYRKLTAAIGGQYMDVGLTQEFHLNPFDLADPNMEPSAGKIKSLLSICELMVVEDEKSKLAKLDRVLLEKAIIELYAEKRKEGRCPVLSDLAKVLEQSDEPVLRSVSKMLYPWTGDRPYGRMLDCPGGFQTSAPICTFDLKGLSNYPDLQSVMILILTEYILSEVERDRDHKKRIILDEAWSLLKSPAAAYFMEYCARTLRKTGSGITFITQGVEEIIASPIGPAIMNNTATKLVMLQRGDPNILREALRLNTQESALIQSLEQRKGEYSEGFLIEGNVKQVVRIQPSPLEYWLATSDAQDNRLLERWMQEKSISQLDAIKLAAEHYPWGVAAGERRIGS